MKHKPKLGAVERLRSTANHELSKVQDQQKAKHLITNNGVQPVHQKRDSVQVLGQPD